MASVDVKITDNSEEVLAAMAEQLEAALQAIGGQAEMYAKQDCPVDTGRLRNSISFATKTAHVNTDTPDLPEDDAVRSLPEERVVVIGTNVEYAPTVEYSDSMRHTTGKAHFLRDAAATHGDEYKRITQHILQT